MKSGAYRHPDGSRRFWYEVGDIEDAMEATLRCAELYPSLGRPAVDIERLVDAHLGVLLDQHCELDMNILGLTEFRGTLPPRIAINRELTDHVDREDSSPGLRGRWRATLAHEASHVVLHRTIFDPLVGQNDLFDIPQGPRAGNLLRCEKSNVAFRGGGTEWREVQANMGMAALLMPQAFFREVVPATLEELGIRRSEVTAGSPAIRRLEASLASRLDVSRQATAIRLETLGYVTASGQTEFLL